MSPHRPHGPRLRDWSQPSRAGETPPPARSAQSEANRAEILAHFRGAAAPEPEPEPADAERPRPTARQALTSMVRPTVTSTGKQAAADAARARMTRMTPSPDPTET